MVPQPQKVRRFQRGVQAAKKELGNQLLSSLKRKGHVTPRRRRPTSPGEEASRL